MQFSWQIPRVFLKEWRVGLLRLMDNIIKNNYIYGTTMISFSSITGKWKHLLKIVIRFYDLTQETICVGRIFVFIVFFGQILSYKWCAILKKVSCYSFKLSWSNLLLFVWKSRMSSILDQSVSNFQSTKEATFWFATLF